MEPAVIFVLRQTKGWRIVIGEQRIGSYANAEAACWAAMSLAMHLREENTAVELRLHDDSGIRKLWPPELVAEVAPRRTTPRRVSAA